MNLIFLHQIRGEKFKDLPGHLFRCTVYVSIFVKRFEIYLVSHSPFKHPFLFSLFKIYEIDESAFLSFCFSVPSEKFEHFQLSSFWLLRRYYEFSAELCNWFSSAPTTSTGKIPFLKKMLARTKDSFFTYFKKFIF